MIPFQATAESIPPKAPHRLYRMRDPLGTMTVNHIPLNPLSFLLRTATIFPDKLAIIHSDVQCPVSYSFSVWAQRIQNLAYALIRAGIRPGDRVAVLAPNCPMITDAHFGILAARAVITPINTRLTESGVDYILNHSGAKLVLVDYEYAHLVKHSKLPIVLSRDTGKAGDDYEEFLSSGRRFSAERGWGGLDLEPAEEASVSLCYTSGTTGKPKGVISTCRGSYLAAVGNVLETRMDHTSVYLWIVPMFHACGWTYPWGCVLAAATQVTIRTVDYDLIWKHFIHSGVTHYCAAPTVQLGIVTSPNARPIDHPIVAIIGGSAPTAHLISELEKNAIRPVHIWGLTETLGPFTRNYSQPGELTLEERAKLMARQGYASAVAGETRVVTVKDDGVLVDVPGDGKSLGEIVVRGNIVMKEYFRDPDATAKAFAGGYFATGDLAVKYSDQSIYLQDRRKDIIISGGERWNASSLAIEQELAAHPDILETAVVARKHKKWGERPMAFVVLNAKGKQNWAGSTEKFEAVLKAWVRGKLPGFAIPEWVDVCERLPKTSTGKIQKTRLRQIAADKDIKSKL